MQDSDTKKNRFKESPMKKETVVVTPEDEKAEVVLPGMYSPPRFNDRYLEEPNIPLAIVKQKLQLKSYQTPFFNPLKKS